MRFASAIAVGLALGALAVGCGAESEVRGTVEDVADALAERDGQKACEPLTNEGQRIVAAFRRLPPVRCASTVEALDPAEVAGCREAEVREVVVFSGEEAAARVGTPDGEVRAGLRNVDGNWRLRTPPCGPGVP